MKPFECNENGVDRFGLFRIGKYPVVRRNVLRPVVILLEALRDCRHISTGSEYAALVDTHIPPVCFIIEVVLNVLRYVDGPKAGCSRTIASSMISFPSFKNPRLLAAIPY